MRLRSMAAPPTKGDVKNITDKLDKMSKTLVENSSTLVQLIEEMREIRKSQQFLSEQYEEIMSASLRLSLAKCKRILTTLSSMAAVNALSFKDCPVRKVSSFCKHRLSPASESNQQPTIIARFCSRRIRDRCSLQQPNIDCMLITRTNPKHAFLSTKVSPKLTVVASTSAYVLKRRTTSSSYGQGME